MNYDDYIKQAKKQALYSSLMNLAGGLMAAGSPSRAPGGNFAALGQSVSQAGQNFGTAQSQAMQQMLMRAKIQQLAQGPKPITRDFKMGDKFVTKQSFDNGRTWVDMGKEYTAPRYKPPGININSPLVSNTYTPLPKGAQAGVAKNIIASGDALNRLNDIDKSWRPEYSTYSGRGKAYLEEFKDKLGVGGDKRFLANYSAWKSRQQQFFNQYRKDITGVAAGEKEMVWIRDSIPNITDSPTAYKAKMRALLQITNALRERHKAALDKGLSPGSPAYRDFLDRNPIQRPMIGGLGPRQGPVGGGFKNLRPVPPR